MKKLLTITAVISIGICLMAIIGAGALIRTSAQGLTYSIPSLIPHRCVGLVLGCSRQLPNGRDNLFFTYRIAAAVQLYEAGKVDYLIVSGDNHVVGYDEPTDMKYALVVAGIPAERVYCDYAGFRTLDSITRAKTIFGQTNVTVISQHFHNQRAIYIARHVGLDALGFNAQEVDPYSSFGTILREQFARIKTILDVCVLNTRPKFGGNSIVIGSISSPSLEGNTTKPTPDE